MKRSLLLFCIPISVLFVACIQQPDEQNPSWKIWGDVYMTIDSSQVIEERHPFCLQETRNYMQGIKPIIFCQHHSFAIPKSSKEIVVSLNSMSENVGKAMLYAKTYDKSMTKIVEDSSDIRSDSWSRKEFRIPAKGASFVGVMLKVEGDTANLHVDNIQRMWFDTLRVTLDGKSVCATIPSGYKVRKKIDKESIIPVDMDEFSGLEKRLEDKKIIGLGESVHGSREFSKLSFNFILKSVFRGECKLILLEMPLYFSVRWELFVQGFLDGKEIDDIKKEIALSSAFQNEDEFAEFLQTLREYNQHNENKVHILGMDTYLLGFPVAMKDSARDLIAAFINGRNKREMIPILNFMDEERSPTKLLGALVEHESLLRAEMGDHYFELGKLILSQYNILASSFHVGRQSLFLYDYMWLRRDYNMWLNTQMLVHNFAKEGSLTIIKAHNAHLNKSEMGYWLYDEPSLGYHIDQEYGDKYASIALIAASGKRIAGVDKSFQIIEKELQYPLSGSIEKLCFDAGLNIFCYPAKEIPEKIRLIRCAGQETKKWDFTYDYPIENNDYILFLDKISPSREKKQEKSRETFDEKKDFLLYGLREKRDSIFREKINYWKNKQ